MTGRSTLVISLLLLSLLIGFVTARDPNCRRGIRRGDACCSRLCGRCGGSGCGRRGKRAGTQCCTGKIRGDRRVCSTANAPCRLDRTLRRRRRRRRDRRRTPRGTSPPTTDPQSPIAPVPPVPVPAPPLPAPLPPTPPMPAPPPPTNPNPTQGSWSIIDRSLRQRTQARHEACFVMLNGLAYLLGGRGTRRVSVFNPATRRWTDRGNMPFQLHHMQCVATRGRIYIVSAWYGGSPRENNRENVYVYNPSSNTWSLEPGMPSNRRRGGAGSAVIGDFIYVVGGNRGGHGPPSQTLGYFDAYNVVTKTWSILPSLPEGSGRDHTGVAVVGSLLCIAGGRDGGRRSFFSAVERSVFCFNFNTNSWERKQDIPTPRGGVAVATTCNGEMMVAGGETGRRLAFSTVEIFNGNTWRRVGNLRTGRHGTGLAVSNCNTCGHIFIASGSGQRGGRPELSSTEVFVPDGAPLTCSSY